MKLFCQALVGLQNLSVTSAYTFPEIAPGLPVDNSCSLSVSTPVVDYGNLSLGQLQEILGAEHLARANEC